MSDQWLYRIYGQEFGPVSLDLVRSLVASGAIEPDDEVRDATRSNWILACAASELRDSIKSQATELAVERRSVRDEWFCRGAAGDYGPLKLIDLIQLAVEGELKPDEEIRKRADDYWKQVGSIQRLVELLPFSSDERRLPQQSFAPNLVDANRLFESSDPPLPDSSLEEDCLLLAESVFYSSSLNQTESQSVSHVDHSMGQGHSPSLASDENNAQETSELDSAERTLDVEMDLLPFPGIRKTSESFVRTNTSIDDEWWRIYSASSSTCFDSHSHIDDADPMASWEGQDTELGQLNSQWMGWIRGEEFGPVSFLELLTWAVTGRLSPMDFVRRGAIGQFVPAVNIPCLFTVQAAANSLSRRISPIIAAEPDFSFESLLDHDVMDPSAVAEWTLAIKPTPNKHSFVGENDLANFYLPDSSVDSADIIDETLMSSMESTTNNSQCEPRSMGVSAMLVVGLVVIPLITGF